MEFSDWSIRARRSPRHCRLLLQKNRSSWQGLRVRENPSQTAFGKLLSQHSFLPQYAQAFYSLRLYLRLFHVRAGQGVLHQGAKVADLRLPNVMKATLGILAALSILASCMDLRAFHLHFAPWTDLIAPLLPERGFHVPIVQGEAERRASLLTLGASLAALLLGFGGAWLTWQKPLSGEWLQRFSLDRLYSTFIVKPLWGCSRWLRGMDRAFLGGLLNRGPSTAAWTMGWLGTRIQNGSVYVYALTMLIGVLGVSLWILYPTPSFEARELEPGRGQLSGSSGFGLSISMGL